MPPKYQNSTLESFDSKTLSRPIPTPSNVAPRGTSSTPNIQASLSTSAMVCNEKSSGSNSWSRVQWPASPKTTVPETLPTSSKSMLNPAPRQSQLSLSPYGWRASSWDLQLPSTLSRRQQGSSMTGGSTPTYSGSGNLMHRGRKRKVRSANGRHMQTLLHLPRTCARVVWRQPTVRTNLVHSRIWALSVRDRSSLAEAAAPTP